MYGHYHDSLPSLRHYVITITTIMVMITTIMAMITSLILSTMTQVFDAATSQKKEVTTRFFSRFGQLDG